MVSRKQISWDTENDRTLLLQCMRGTARDLPLKKMVCMFPGATIKALEERIAKLRRKAKDELAAIVLLPPDAPVSPPGSNLPESPSGATVPTGNPGPSDPSHVSVSDIPSLSVDHPSTSNSSAEKPLPREALQSSLITFPIPTTELISPRKRRLNRSAIRASTTQTPTASISTSKSKKRSRVSITAQRAAEKAKIFGGAVDDDEDAAFAEARLKRVKKLEERDEDGDGFKEIDKLDMVGGRRHRRVDGTGGGVEAEKERGDEGRVWMEGKKVRGLEGAGEEIKEEEEEEEEKKEKKVDALVGEREVGGLEDGKVEVVMETKIEG